MATNARRYNCLVWCVIYQKNIDIAIFFNIVIVSNFDITLADFDIYRKGDNYQNTKEYFDKSTAFSERLHNHARNEGWL